VRSAARNSRKMRETRRELAGSDAMQSFCVQSGLPCGTRRMRFSSRNSGAGLIIALCVKVEPRPMVQGASPAVFATKMQPVVCDVFQRPPVAGRIFTERATRG
jgi:hypothetical protein